ncbi:mitochondrial ribosomal protein L28-domain-containing protein [Scheffersomyces coipomensis]|uniref:mitochondrial ribosomal protein L28-domain-containing protein n=1 Tax=Scheffersomyces coipomensis TaxID=1788519 RepID=UPI00315CB823
MFKSMIPNGNHSHIITNTIFKTFSRGKRTATTINAATQKIVNQLSALSASRKQPKLIRLCQEDLIKHRTIVNAWKVFKRQREQKRTAQLKKQYESIVNAMEDLKTSSPELFELASEKPKKAVLFPLEMRTPTDYPANTPWIYNYSPPAKFIKAKKPTTPESS